MKHYTSHIQTIKITKYVKIKGKEKRKKIVSNLGEINLQLNGVLDIHLIIAPLFEPIEYLIYYLFI